MIKKTTTEYYSRGKLLLTGEYLVLDGALALAVPTQSGQSLLVEKKAAAQNILSWTSLTNEKKVWFEGRFELPSGRYLSGSDAGSGQRLEQLLQAGKALRPELWENEPGYAYQVHTALEFPQNWGLGSSSTLVANLAQWWKVDAYQLLTKTFGGSGYDLACAQADGPICYQLRPDGPSVKSADFFPPFSAQLYFLFLEQKQNSREGIAHYKKQGNRDPSSLRQISDLTEQAIVLTKLGDFQKLMNVHERIIAGIIGISPIKERLFPDFPGAVKSLGAWGGDFALVASELPFETLKAYFSTRSYPILIPYSEMVFGDK